MRSRSHHPNAIAEVELGDHLGERRVTDFAVEVDLDRINTFVTQSSDRFDQNVDTLITIDRAGGHDPEFMAWLEIRSFGGTFSRDPIRQSLDASSKRDPRGFDFSAYLMGDGDVCAMKTSTEIISEFGDQTVARGAEARRDAVAELPAPRDAALLQCREQSQAADSGEVAQIGDVGIEGYDHIEEFVYVVRVDEPRVRVGG